ncbi:MAG: mechanosensitive ion channel [Proteobacteria bacterium]|nr:mechanosensitive ion channel [Pseudomonadota bacterium]
MNWLKLLIRCIPWIILCCLLGAGIRIAIAAGDNSFGSQAAAVAKAIYKNQQNNVKPTASTSANSSATNQEQINDIIQTLQDPQAREKLIAQLKILAQAQTITATPASPAKNQTSITLVHLSNSISQIHFGAKDLVIDFLQTKKIFLQTLHDLENSKKRNFYGILLLKCILIVGLGIAALSLSSRYIPRLYRRFIRTGHEKFLKKFRNLFILWFINLFPIAIFALVSYLLLVFFHVGEEVQWILLAWISAFIMIRLLFTLYDFIFALIQHFPNLFILNESSLSFLRNWCRLLTYLIVFGYFVLQIALYMGISLDTYDSLTKFLGFLVVLFLIVLIIRNPLRMFKTLAARRTRVGAMIDEDRIARIDVVFRFVAITYLLLLYIVWVVRADHFFWVVLKGTIFSIIIIFLAIKIAQWINRFLSREFKVTHAFRKRLPGFEGRFRRYRSILNFVLRVIVYILAIIAIFKIWGGEIYWLPDALKALLILKAIAIISIGLAAMFIWEISNSLIELSLTKRGEDLLIESGRTHTLLTVARKTILIAIVLVAGLMILSQVGVNIGPLLASAGVLGLAISLGAQKLLQDIITGFFILLENQIVVGDYVTIGDKAGTVEMISIRTVRLRDSAGVVHLIPYSSIITISNFTKEFSYALFDINIAYKENVDQVITVLRQLAVTLRKDPEFKPLILEPLDVLGLDRFADSAMVVRIRLKTKAGFQWKVAREFNRRMKQKFDELNIEIPFPHTVLFFGEKKDGEPPPGYIKATVTTQSEQE